MRIVRYEVPGYALMVHTMPEAKRPRLTVEVDEARYDVAVFSTHKDAMFFAQILDKFIPTDNNGD